MDRVLEVFNSDAPPAARRGALAGCFADAGLAVAPLRAGNRPSSGAGPSAVDAIVAASSRLGRATPRVRVFMEAGDEAETPPGPGDASLCLDVYAKGEAPGLAAVLKGAPATTLVLWRAQGNKITHAWVAPEREGFENDWAAVSEESVLESRAMAATNEILEAELPPGRDFWAFHFNNYETDIDLVC